MKLKAVSGIMLTLLLTSMLTIAFNIKPANAQTRIAGVEVGDWAKYAINASWNSNDTTWEPPSSWVDINNAGWVMNRVLAVSGNNITFELVWHFINGTELTTVNYTDVDWGKGDSLWFISANLSKGNYIYNEFCFFIPISNTTSRTYLDIKKGSELCGIRRNT